MGSCLGMPVRIKDFKIKKKKVNGYFLRASLVAHMAKNLPAMCETWRRSLGEGNVNPLQYSCLENRMDRGAWWATIQRVSKESDTTE